MKTKRSEGWQVKRSAWLGGGEKASENRRKTSEWSLLWKQRRDRWTLLSASSVRKHERLGCQKKWAFRVLPFGRCAVDRGCWPRRRIPGSHPSPRGDLLVWQHVFSSAILTSDGTLSTRVRTQPSQSDNWSSRPCVTLLRGKRHAVFRGNFQGLGWCEWAFGWVLVLACAW